MNKPKDGPDPHLYHVYLDSFDPERTHKRITAEGLSEEKAKDLIRSFFRAKDDSQWTRR